eukprot:7792882-Lingulodinium_polyedra.AAC.1
MAPRAAKLGQGMRGEGAPGQAQIAPQVVSSPLLRAIRPGQGRPKGSPEAARSAVINQCAPARGPAH